MKFEKPEDKKIFYIFRFQNLSRLFNNCGLVIYLSIIIIMLIKTINEIKSHWQLGIREIISGWIFLRSATNIFKQVIFREGWIGKAVDAETWTWHAMFKFQASLSALRL